MPPSASEVSSDDSSTRGDEAATTFSASSVVLARTKFDKRGSFGRFKPVYLELRGFQFLEYSAMSSSKPIHVRQLEQAGSKVADAATLVNEPSTFLLVTGIAGKKKDGTRAFYRAQDPDTAYTWLTCLRRAIGEGDIKGDRGAGTKGLVDVTMFSDPCCVTDIVGTIVDVNQVCCDLFGWDQPSDMIGKSNKILIPPRIAANHDQYTKRHDQTGNKRLIGKPREMKGMRRDGSLVSIYLSLGEIGTGEDKRYVATMRGVGGSAIDIEKASREGSGIDDSFSGVEGKSSKSTSGGDDAGEGRDIQEMRAAIDDAAAGLKKQLSAIRARNGTEVDELRAKVAHLKARNEMLSDTVAEIDEEVNSLKLSSQIARRALDMLISSDSDSALRSDAGDDAILNALRQAIREEVQAAMQSSATTLFRGDSFNTRKISAFMFVVGAQYLNETLASVLQKVRNNTAGLQIEKLDDSADEEMQRTISRKLAREAGLIIEAIAQSAEKCPQIIREVFRFLKTEVQSNFFGDAANPKQLITGFVFLRFFVPAVVAPSRYGLLSESDDKKAAANEARIFATLGRLVQCLANGSIFPGKPTEVGPAVMNRFLRKNQKIFSSFVKDLLAEESS